MTSLRCRRLPVRRFRPLRHELLEERSMLAITAQLLADLNPGTASSRPYQFAEMNGFAYFGTNDRLPDIGRELWKTDGTPAGTTLVKDIVPGTGESRAQELVNVNGMLYFRAYNAANESELW